MRLFFQALQSQPLPVRRRFVILATAGSFTIIVLVWGVLSSIGGQQAAEPPSALSPSAEETGAGILGAPVPADIVPTSVPTPTSAPSVDVGNISSNLLRALGGGTR